MMTSEQQQNAFHEAQQRASRITTHGSLVGRDLGQLGDSVYCYIPRQVRHLSFEQIVAMPFSELAQLYPSGTWAIADLTLTLCRITDRLDGDSDHASAEATTETNTDNHACETDPEQVAQTESVIQEATRPPQPASLIAEIRSCATDEELLLKFENLKRVLVDHTDHPLLDEVVAEFLEPTDSDIPTEYLTRSVREVLESPFARLARRWVGRHRVECLLTLLDRAAQSISSHKGIAGENLIANQMSERLKPDAAMRSTNLNGGTWTSWCEVVQNHRMAGVKLGTIARRLRDLPRHLWGQPLSNFVCLSLHQVAELPGIGVKKLDLIVDPIRQLVLNLDGLNCGSGIRLRVLAGPLGAVHDWIERVIEAGSYPSMDELAAHLLSPLAVQLRHDLPEREARIAIRRMRIEQWDTFSTLDEIAIEYGISKERVRQISNCGPEILQVRLPQGRDLLHQLYRQLSSHDRTAKQSRIVLHVATQCFMSSVTGESPFDALDSWEVAGRHKLTPMTTEQLYHWSGRCFPGLVPLDVLSIIKPVSLCYAPAGQEALWFTRSECDRLLYLLFQLRGPAKMGELLLLYRVSAIEGTAHQDSEDGSALDERAIWGRISRDPRFVECDERQLLPAERCGFQRRDDIWHVLLVPVAGSPVVSRECIDLNAVTTLVVAGLSELGIGDATVGGVHRFVNEALARTFRAELPSSITPLILADMLVKLSDGLIRTMRRRRLRWDSPHNGLTARGKLGWVGQVVSEYGQPLTLREVDQLMRKWYQDYAQYVVKQLVYAMDEDGETDERVELLTEAGSGIPTLVVPRAWNLNATQDNVSQGVVEIARELANRVRAGRIALRDLNSVGWLRSLVESYVSASPPQRDGFLKPAQPKSEVTGSHAMGRPIMVTGFRNSTSRHPSPIPALLITHRDMPKSKAGRGRSSVYCLVCGYEIVDGQLHAIESKTSDRTGGTTAKPAGSIRTWCTKCIEYVHTEPIECDDDVSTQTIEMDQPRFIRRINTEVLLGEEELASLHSQDDVSRMFSPTSVESVPNLLRYAFSRILISAPARKPWSMAELSLKDADYDWLRTLFERVTAFDLREFIALASPWRGCSVEAQLGTVLFLLESELARRHASEGQLWSSIHHQICWQRDTDQFLFNHRQPNARHKSYLETAANEIGLRSAFGEDSAQEWYQSVFLQFGFSKKSFKARLQNWLAGQNLPVSVTRLLGHDGRYASGSFQAIWLALKEYRQGSLDRIGLQANLDCSPWILPEWHADLIQVCREQRLGLSEAVADDNESDEEEVSNADLGELSSADHFIGPVRIDWATGAPRFVCEPTLSENFELQEDADIVIDGKCRSRLILQEDGTWDATLDEIELPTAAPLLSAELRSSTGEVIAKQTLVLWNESEDVEGYMVKSGRRVDAWGREIARGEICLIFTADLRIDPERPPMAILGSGSRHMVRLTPSETTRTKLYLGDDLLWEPSAAIIPEWRRQVGASIEFRPPTAPTQFRFSVSHPNAVTVTAIRFRKNLLQIRRESTQRSLSDWLEVDSRLQIGDAIAFTSLLRMGEETTELRNRFTYKSEGNLWRRDDHWEVVPERLTCTLRELRQTEFRLAPPESEIEGDGWHLFEGRRWIDSVKNRPQRILQAEGWGAPLLLRAAPYNCCQSDLRILSGIQNRGEIRDVEFGPDGATTIMLDRQVAPDESHSIILLDNYGEFRHISHEELIGTLDLVCTAQSWKVSLANTDRRVIALGIAYNGERLGSWWQADWTDVLRRPPSVSDDHVLLWASRVADALRWFRLPLLGDEYLDDVIAFAREFAVPVLSVWLCHTAPGQLSHDAVGEGWWCVVRTIFAEWTPSAAAAEDLDATVEASVSDRDAPRLRTTALSLCNVSPVLAARFIQSSLELDCFVGPVQSVRAVLQAIRKRVLGSHSMESLALCVARDVARRDEPPQGTLDFVYDSLLFKSVAIWRNKGEVDESALDRSNIEIAMRLSAFRSLAFVACLDQISKELA